MKLPHLIMLSAASLLATSSVMGAEKDDAASQLAQAIKFRDGKGVERNYPEAMRLAHLSADAGNANAMDFLGWMYFTGKGAAHQPKLAAGYFAAAAEKSPQAAWNLGQCYFAAQGVPHDVAKALETWQGAAAMGHGRAASTAAMVLHAGDGVAADAKTARKLAERAAELNDRNGLVFLGELHWRDGDEEKAKAAWTKVAAMGTPGATGQPEQAGDAVAAQQGADLLKLAPLRRSKPEPGNFALVEPPHAHQGWNNCGATSCAIYARSQGRGVGSWEFKKHCPSPMGTGTDWSDLVDAAKKIGLNWNLLTFSPDDDGFAKATAFARREIDAGRALVIDFKYIGPQYQGGAAGHTLLLTGYIAKDDLYILCNPAIATPGLQLMTAADLKRFWRSDGYSHTSGGQLRRPVITLASEP
jgi:uncharacterized protein